MNSQFSGAFKTTEKKAIAMLLLHIIKEGNFKIFFSNQSLCSLSPMAAEYEDLCYYDDLYIYQKHIYHTQN